MAIPSAPTLTLPASLTLAEARALYAFRDWLWQTLPDQVERLILFGSKARGEAHPGSDLDLLVALREFNSARHRAISDFIVDLQLESGVDITAVVYGRESLEEEIALGMPFVRNVAAEGIALWGEPIMVKGGKPAEVAREFIQSARDHLAAAKKLKDDQLNRGAIGEAYYAFLDAADAALATKKITPKSHAGTIDLFGLHFIKKGPVAPKYSKWFKQARDWRIEGTYQRKLDWTEAEVRTAIESAEEFVNLIESLVPTLLQEADHTPPPDTP